jgi:hypothetical protein
MNMSASESRSNPYRFGVLEGNHAEERFALDMLRKQQEVEVGGNPRAESSSFPRQR